MASSDREGMGSMAGGSPGGRALVLRKPAKSFQGLAFVIREMNLTVMRFAWMPAALLACVLALLAVWAIDDRPPVIYRGNPIVTAVDQDVVLLQFDVKRARLDCSATWQRWVSDSAGFKWWLDDRSATEEIIRQLERESPGKVRLLLPLPDGMRRGHMTYNVRMIYYCHPLNLFPQRIAYQVPFYVAPMDRGPR